MTRLKNAAGLLLGLIVCGLPVAASALEMALSVASEPAAAGQPVTVTVMVYNHGAQTAPATLPASLPFRVSSTDRAVLVTAKAVSAEETVTASVAPGDFHRVRYTLKLPPEIHGLVALEVPGLPVAGLTVAVTPVKAAGQVAEKAAPTDSRPARLDRLADNFFGHEPVYFLVGTDPDHAKFQISFKYRLLNPKGSLASHWQRLENIYFGYTQTSLWDWESDSAPFYDSSYMPEFFYYRPDIPRGNLTWFSRFSLQSGVLHESNGKDGSESRSLNMVYLKPGALIETGSHSHFSIEPRIWAYVGDLEDNPDIATYRGYFDVEIAWELRDSWKLSTVLRKGSGAGKGSAQFDATYPLVALLGGNLDVYLQMQYYTGYAESLLSYDERFDFVRIGLALFR